MRLQWMTIHLIHKKKKKIIAKFVDKQNQEKSEKMLHLNKQITNLINSFFLLL